MKKRVLHIIDHLGLGGAQTIVKGIFEGNNNSNYFLYALRKTDIITHIDHKNIFISGLSLKYSFPLLQLRKFIKENNIKILHCHLAKSQIIGGVLKILFFPNIKLVFHEHGQMLREGKIYPNFINFFRNQVDKYIAISKLIKKSIQEKTKIKEEKISIIYNFVDLNRFKISDISQRNIFLEKYGIKNTDFLIGFAGRLIEIKGWELYFYFAIKLLKNHKDFKFIICGIGPDENELKERIEISGFKDQFTYLGYEKNMTQFYNSLHLFVFPSFKEALGLTGLEANASGCPVVASNIEGLNEIMIDGKNALLFEKGNIDDGVEKIEKIYKDEGLRKMLISNGREEVKKYSLDKYLIDLNKMYEEL